MCIPQGGACSCSGGLVGAHEIAKLLGDVSRQRVSQVTGRGDFPPPVATLALGRVWAYDDVRRWADARGRRLEPLAGDESGPPAP